MNRILLVCAAGMSTRMLVSRMKERATEQRLDVEINALPIAEAKEQIINNDVDIVMLGPQVRFQKQEIEAMAQGQIPVVVIDMASYGKMDGQAVLSKALQLLAVDRSDK